MADNVEVDTGTGISVATDDIGGFHYQRVKITWGADGTATEVAAASPMPTVQTGAIPAGTNNIGDVDVLTVNGVAPSFATGVRDAGTQRVTIATNDVVPASQSGTWNIGTVTTVTAVTAITNALPAGTNNIGDMDVLSIVPGTAATNLGKAIDTAAGATDTGVAALAIRDDALATLTPIETDYVPLRTNSRGAQWTTSESENVTLGGLRVLNGGAEYETVAASQTAQVLGATGATGDYLMGLLVVPATTSPGNVLLLDNATSITVFVGGATSVSNLVPFLIPLGMISVSGAWKVTTGANVSVIGIGNFT